MARSHIIADILGTLICEALRLSRLKRWQMRHFDRFAGVDRLVAYGVLLILSIGDAAIDSTPRLLFRALTVSVLISILVFSDVWRMRRR